MTSGDLACLWGCSLVTVGKLTTERVIRRKKNGRYDAIDCNHAYISWREKVVAAKASRGSGDSKKRLADAKATLAEIEVAKERGKLVPAAQVHTLYRAAGERIKIRMLAIPSRVAPRLGSVKKAQEAAALIHEEIVLALTELNQLPDTAADEPDEEE